MHFKLCRFNVFTQTALLQYIQCHSIRQIPCCLPAVAISSARQQRHLVNVIELQPWLQLKLKTTTVIITAVSTKTQAITTTTTKKFVERFTKIKVSNWKILIVIITEPRKTHKHKQEHKQQKQKKYDRRRQEPTTNYCKCKSAAHDCGVEGKSICEFAHSHPLNLCVQWILCAINTHLWAISGEMSTVCREHRSRDWGKLWERRHSRRAIRRSVCRPNVHFIFHSNLHCRPPQRCQNFVHLSHWCAFPVLAFLPALKIKFSSVFSYCFLESSVATIYKGRWLFCEGENALATRTLG